MAGEAIFIGYRRDDTADVAGRVHEHFARRFGKGRIFMDVDNLRPGADFGEYIKTVLPRCRVALILIGPHWLDAKDEHGARRLDDPDDWVRVEIETAMATEGLEVVPVLVNGARMPRAEELPPSLQPLLRRHAAIIRRNPDFSDDVGKLINALRAGVNTGVLDFSGLGGERKATESAASPSAPRLPAWVPLAGLLAVAVFAVLVWQPWRSGATAPQSPSGTTGTETTLATTDPTTQTSGVYRVGQVFRDCADICPEMVVVPAGNFIMGSPPTEGYRQADEGPQHLVTLRSFAAGIYPVTNGQWAACAAAGGCTGNRHPTLIDGTALGDDWPVQAVSWDDVHEFVQWLSTHTSQRYRLMSEAEWEYAARAGSQTRFPWGDQPSVCDVHAVNGANRYCLPRGETQRVGMYPPNRFGLYDVVGGVWEWVEDCYHATYAGAPSDGSAWTTPNCEARVARGSVSGFHDAFEYRVALRIRSEPYRRGGFGAGLRVARDL